MKGLWELLVLGILVFCLIWGMMFVKRTSQQLRIINEKADIILERTGR